MRFRAHRRHTSLQEELSECLEVGLERMIRREERFRQTAPRLRQKTSAFLQRDQLAALIDDGRA
ncbi:hypothetical protein [Ruficoccus sp. ZRK36]|uniref:hypothetical protein n=1 Tax=Ruficoccus sp. ZRK36 TaxID=2866311 RepID=UPI001C738540|nr:hypothetical protein [Ruficoccus sp. ZRK36]QYY36447.1 hypothetical protein K0V07_03005 [Ruficoccus sp. ZRK36]